MSIVAALLMTATSIISALTLFAWLRCRRRLGDEQALRTEIQRLQGELHRAQRARSTFLAAANHDLRQPLQALFCFSTILASRVRGRTRTIADQMQDSLHALNAHLESLVELSRLDAGIVEPEPMTVRVDAVLGEIEARFAPLAESKRLRLRVVAPSRLACSSDPVMLRRILANLVDNAIRFTSAGGVVIGARRRGTELRIEVWDSGVGMTAEQLANVFEEFYQVGNPQRDRSNGLGLGLAVVDRLIHLLPGHRLDVRSSPGIGSVFALQLPLAAQPARSHPCAPVLHGPWPKPRQLAVPVLHLGA